jgi:hypothetical protein
MKERGANDNDTAQESAMKRDLATMVKERPLNSVIQ